MMADRLALTRTTGPSVPARPRATVPAFLNKLYSMVNDTQTDELIRWAEDGESFFVPNHERLGREVLPRFFKHGNFASFVRQLNMYGFHKVPQLQQGVLKNETETELWQFSEPHFQRDRPDMLDRIQRKKGPGATGSAPIDVQTTDASSAHMAAGTAIDGLSASSGPLALHSIAGELSVIKLHQSSISAELQALQESNNQLWQETIAAQERHKKQQDTIERILKFLAGVFGSAPSGANASRQGEGRDRSPTPSQAQRHKGRLLIGDAQAFLTLIGLPKLLHPMIPLSSML
ncbi:hypothetical protein BS47DRAFT_286666 [Hydnum rufescens UP504]|uniref:HSF-type DNA-binding domain-containing protein n=1 Tax=Hydnum rufescens UP504 TaxID=1448309 RepID=A0A9P6DQP5_9AGAM|nr:hypothetical protein BS47DRAFT_286666 [Hydnum rufescens UP504]